MGDELLEVTETQTLSREAAAARLRELADQLSRHNQVELTVEIELGDESEIEVEIRW